MFEGSRSLPVPRRVLIRAADVDRRHRREQRMVARRVIQHVGVETSRRAGVER